MNARAIVCALGGRWHCSYGMAKCPCHDDGVDPALKISNDSRKRDGIDLHCFAGCDWRDIKIELVRRGLLADLFPDAPRSDRIVNPKDGAAFPDHPNRFAAINMWATALPARGTAVESYLRRRGIDGPIPPTLRYVPSARYGRTGLAFPCMVAGVTLWPSRHVVAVHRTFLTADGAHKAQVANPRMMLGPCSGGAVRLARHGTALAIAEGIETALSVMVATEMPTWATLSTSGMRSVVIPPDTEEVFICTDADTPGVEAAQVLARRLSREGHTVRIARPPVGKDFNDALLAGAV